MRTFGLVGYPLSHSFSQKYFTEKFAKESRSIGTDCEFINFPLENINDFPTLLESHPMLCGLSVTIPHKQSVMKFLDEVDEVAGKIGAVNCIKILKTEGGMQKISGYNTDVIGFEESLKPLLKPYHTKALVLGTGGGAKAIAYVLNKLKIDFIFLSRTGNPETGIISYNALNHKIISEHFLVINTTPAGMFPDRNVYPQIPYEHLTEKHLLYDLIYNPEETLFLRKGKEKGAVTKNGLEMLHLQAEKAWAIWNS